MKAPQPDLNVAIVNSFIAKAGANRKLKKLWGTTTVNGVEVLNARRHYYKPDARPDNYEKLFKFLKVYDDVKDYDGKGLKSAWFTLNKSNGPEDSSVSNTYFRDNLNRMWWDSNDGVMPPELTLTTTIVIGKRFDGQPGIAHIDWDASKEIIAQSIVDNYDDIWDTNRIEQEGIGVVNKGSIRDQTLNIDVPDEDDLSPDDPWLSIVARNALRSGGVPCTIKDVEVGIGRSVDSSVYNTAVITLEIPYHNFTSSEAFVVGIADDSSANYFSSTNKNYRNAIKHGQGSSTSLTNGAMTQVSAKQVTFYETEDDIDATTVSRSYLSWEGNNTISSVYDNFWVRGGDVWYLKADVIKNPKAYGTTHTKLNTYLFSILDTGYKKKKVSFWKKLVAIVVFVIAVVLTYVSAGATSAWTSQVTAAAYAVIVGALVISITAAVSSALGMEEWAMSFASVSKDIEPLVTVASVIMVIDIVSTAAEKISEAGLSEFATTAIADIAKDFVTGLGDIVAGNLTSTAAISVINKSLAVYTSSRASKLEDINSKNRDLKAEYDKLAEEASRESDIMKGYMNIYSRPATADQSMYSSLFDLPYERGGGTLSMGNIQKTTKKALRPADYDEGMFEGFLLM